MPLSISNIQVPITIQSQRSIQRKCIIELKLWIRNSEDIITKNKNVPKSRKPLILADRVFLQALVISPYVAGKAGRQRKSGEVSLLTAQIARDHVNFYLSFCFFWGGMTSLNNSELSFMSQWFRVAFENNMIAILHFYLNQVFLIQSQKMWVGEITYYQNLLSVKDCNCLMPA